MFKAVWGLCASVLIPVVSGGMCSTASTLSLDFLPLLALKQRVFVPRPGDMLPLGDSAYGMSLCVIWWPEVAGKTTGALVVRKDPPRV